MIKSWQLLIFICFCINAVLAINFIFQFAYEEKPKNRINPHVMLLNISSAIWSIGMGMMSIQTEYPKMYFWRTFGILGTFLFMMTVQKTMCIISEIPSRFQLLFGGISYFGIFIFVLYSIPGQTIFVQNKIGTTFYFKQGLINIIYCFYFFIVSVNIFIVTLYITHHHTRKQVRTAGKRFLMVESLIFIGSIFDMMIPGIGKPALPGSAITHFWGVFIFWYAIHQMYRSEITISNMSEYIYYSLGTPVLVFDSKNEIKIMNDAACAFLRIGHLENQNKSLAISNLFETDNSIFEFDSKSQIIETLCLTNSKKCELAISKIFDSYDDTIGFIILLNDLTEHELVISKLEQAKLAADAANMSKSLFLANMSHEMRTPLNAILGFSDIALMHCAEPKTKEYFEHIKSAGETLLSVINQVLDISKIELGKQELTCTEYEPARIFKDVELIIGVQARKKGLHFHMYVNTEVPSILYGDKDRIREILINILNNSVKYTHSGNVELNISVASKNADQVTVVFRISDTGIGIRKEDIPTIFDRFKRIDEKFNTSVEGTGLGLSITKGLVNLMNGTIDVESTYGIGTTFTVAIPQKVVDDSPIQLADDSSKNAPLIEKEKVMKKAKNLKFLAVDDNDVNLMVVSGILTEFGITHDTATNGYDAIEMCKQSQYDVVLLDQMMPGIDGTETMKRIRNISGYMHNDNCRIIALTANVIEGAKEELLHSGFDAYLAKPIDIDEFQQVLFS